MTQLQLWRMVEKKLFKEYPLLQEDAALDFFTAKYEQLSAKRTHVSQLMTEDMTRRGVHHQ